MSKYRIFKTFSGYEIQSYGLRMLDGCPDYDWKTIDRAETEEEADRKLAFYLGT